MLFRELGLFLLGMGVALGGAVYLFRRNTRKVNKTLKESQAELSNAVSMLKHDLNSPLTAIILGLQSLEKEARSPKITKVLEILTNSASQMKVMIKESIEK